MIKGNVQALKTHVLVEDMDAGEKLVNGIIRLDDNGKDHGIHPRWAKVYAVGSEIKSISVGQWVLVDHGQWTYRIKVETDDGIKFIQRIKFPEGVLCISDVEPDKIKL